VLPSEYRIKNQDEIRAVFRSKFSTKTQNTLIKIQKSDKLNFNIVVVVSKKIFKKANKRNRIRRKINAIFETLKTRDRLPPSLNLVIQVLNKNIIHLKQPDLESELIPNIGAIYKKMIEKTKNTPKSPN
jgi:ribonuclease P protein component